MNLPVPIGAVVQSVIDDAFAAAAMKESEAAMHELALDCAKQLASSGYPPSTFLSIYRATWDRLNAFALQRRTHVPQRVAFLARAASVSAFAEWRQETVHAQRTFVPRIVGSACAEVAR